MWQKKSFLAEVIFKAGVLEYADDDEYEAGSNKSC